MTKTSRFPHAEADEIYSGTVTAVGILRQQILVAQGTGLLLILVPVIVLGQHYISLAFFAIPVLLATLLFFAAVYFDKLPGTRRLGALKARCLRALHFLDTSPPVGSLISSAERLNRYRALLLLLVMADVAIILGAIGLTKGVVGSHLSFVLLLIPGVLGIINRGGKTLLWVGVGIAALALLDACLPQNFAPSFVIAQGWLWIAPFLEPLDPAQSKQFPLAVALGLLVGIAATLYQSYISAGAILPVHVKSRVMKFIPVDLLGDRELRKSHVASVDRAYKRMSRVVARTNIPELHCSEVHPLTDVVFHAYILALPGTLMRSGDAAQRAAEMTFGSHWLDDMVDCLGYHEMLGRECAAINSLDLKTADSETIAKAFSPYGIHRVLAAVRGPTGWFSRLAFGGRTWPEGVEAGLVRVFCGGFIQRGTDQSKDAVERIRSEALADCGNDLRGLLSQQNTVFWWSISKTAMPLVLGTYWSPTDFPQLWRLSLLIDIAMFPILVHHDLDEEERREEVPKIGFDGKKGKNLDTELRDAVNGAEKAMKVALSEIPAAAIWQYMRPVMQLAYGRVEGCLRRKYPAYVRSVEQLIATEYKA